MSKLIALSDGQMTLVDDWNYLDIVYAGPWHFNTRGEGYARRWKKIGKGRINEFLHHFIGRNIGLIGDIDHRNGNGLDNREKNLRSATDSQNAMNAKIERNNTTGRKGIRWIEERQKFRVRITVEGQIFSLGHFETLLEATQVRKQAEIRYFGQYNREEV
jgi:hypothetical protein